MEEGMKASRQGILKFIKRYKATGSIGRQPGSGRRSKITPEIMKIVDEQCFPATCTSVFLWALCVMKNGTAL